MFLCRIKAIDRLRFEPAGEFGKLLGLDRIPEVKTMRKKLKLLSDENAVKEWAGQLSKDWLEATPDLAGVLFIDGHVSLYFGNKTQIAQTLCFEAAAVYERHKFLLR